MNSFHEIKFEHVAYKTAATLSRIEDQNSTNIYIFFIDTESHSFIIKHVKNKKLPTLCFLINVMHGLFQFLNEH